jgi:hypothetical protein
MCANKKEKIKCVSHFRKVGGFLGLLRFPPLLKLTQLMIKSILKQGDKDIQANFGLLFNIYHTTVLLRYQEYL